MRLRPDGQDDRVEPVVQPRIAAEQLRDIERAPDRREDAQHDQRPGHHPGRLVQVRLLLLARPVRAVEGVQHEARHVERREQRRRQAECPEQVPDRFYGSARERCREDFVLREEPGEWRHTGDCQGRDPHERRRPRQVAPEAAHVAHVLRILMRVCGVIGVVHRVDHAAGAEKQQRLEEGVGGEVEDAGRHGARTHTDEHVAELRDGGVREDPFDVPLLERDRRGEQRRQGAHAGHHRPRDGREREEDVAARHEVDARRHHGGGVDQRRDGRGSLHRIGEPRVEGDLGRLAGAAEEEEQRDRRDEPSAGGERDGRAGEHVPEVE